MKVSVLLLTHSGVGPALLGAVRGVIGPLPLKTAAVEAGFHEEPEQVYIRATAVIRELDQGGGILILTDLYGATPSNVAARLVNLGCSARRVAGVNLPMLLRVMNYSEQNLDELVATATTGARNGVVIDHA
jgi:mannose PTS system EIIA component